MEYEVKLQGINIPNNHDWDKSFTIIAFGDVTLPALSMTLRGCALARKGGEFMALPPKAQGSRPGDLGIVSWEGRSPFAKAILAQLLAGYRTFGGEMPPEPTKAQIDCKAARRRVSEKAAAKPAEPAAPKEPADPDLARVIANRHFPSPDNDNVAAEELESVEAGLHRMLNVEEAEEAERVCG